MHSVHPGRRISRKFDPFGLERMKLRMNHRPGKRDESPAAPIASAAHQTVAAFPSDGRHEPVSTGIRRDLTQLTLKRCDAGFRAGIEPDRPNLPSADEEYPFVANGRGIRVNGRTERELFDFAA